MKDIHDMIQTLRIDTRSPEATEVTISRLLDIIKELNEKIDRISWRDTKYI
jgi:hypothetical protein